jgi:lipopolysaccharide exporter
LKLFKTDFFKSAGTLFSGSLIAQAVSFGALYFLADLYDPYQFGTLETFVKLASIGTVVSGLRYELGIVAVDQEKEAQEITRLSLCLTFIFSFGLFIIMLLFKQPIADLLKIESPSTLYFVPLAIIMMGSTETLVLWGNRIKKYKEISANRIAGSASGTVYKLLHPSLEIAGNGLIIGQLLSALVALIHIAIKFPVKIFATSRDQLVALVKKHKSFAIYSTPGALLNVLATSMPFFMLAAFDGQGATGHLGMAYKLTYLPMSMVGMALGQVFFERNARLKKDKTETAAISHQLFNTMFWTALIPVVILSVWADELVPYFLGAKWTEAGIFIQLTIPFYFAMYLTTSFSSAFVTYDKLKVQLVYNLCFLLITSGALYAAYSLGLSTRVALAWFCIAGVILRIGILNYFFYLFGKNLITKTIFAILITGILIYLGFGIKEGF